MSYLGHLLGGGQDRFVTVSCRIAKLGISEEALQAWHLEPKQYFVLIIRYTAGYRDLDRIISSATAHGGSGVQMRAGMSDRYKVAIDEAIAAFAILDDRCQSRKSTTRKSKGSNGLGRFFIGRPLDELMNDRLIPILRYRLAMGFPWTGAEDFLNDSQGRNLSEKDGVDAKYWAEDTSHQQRTLPKIVTHDHLSDRTKQHSFPLLAFQYALRHLVRCTEFCLVCHCKVKADFEALKPYVCSKPLCLYQYMSLGFGPSIEHEIMTQPHVIDLLISFCYTSACHRKLRYLPTGMALMVPSPALVPQSAMLYPSTSYNQPRMAGVVPGQKPPPKPKSTQSPKTYPARFDQQRMELMFDADSPRVLHPGNWISFMASGTAEERYHCRVVDVLYPTVRLSTAVIKRSRNGAGADGPNSLGDSQGHLGAVNQTNIAMTLAPAALPTPLASPDVASSKQYQQINFAIYDQNFDELDADDKQNSIVVLLDTLPSVSQMSSFIQSKGGQDSALRTWTDRISSAALGLLRWIIASNRSCIIQVDSLDNSTRKPEERVSGMPGWMQFRFAQGAPDKEQRFVTSIRDTTLTQKHPTLFAWHGSPLYNWHGIVREGLHFDNADHGRAFGNGCYHSLHCSTSMGYSGGMNPLWRGSSDRDNGAPVTQWSHSQLKISSAIVLNEIINAPSQFVSRTPHLVVAQLDWIQSRYLFVKCNNQGIQIADSVPSQTYVQDPSYTPMGEGNNVIKIPITAVSKSRRTPPTTAQTGNKKIKLEEAKRVEEEVLLSDDTDAEDLAILFSDAEDGSEVVRVNAIKERNGLGPPIASQRTSHQPKTDFVLGTVDHKSLPILEPPSYATSMATKALQRELTATLKVLDTHPAHELGWFIDRELISNVYQWIVELHSFESHLPLAKDLKQKGLKSVVTEIRFGKDYPMSPPFVRVIRPRFMSFMQGGGGHVTAGGALCMELLTNNGWSAVSNIESVLLQVRLAMSSTDPKPARLEPGVVRDYQVGEAVDAFIRACHAHGVSRPEVVQTRPCHS